MKRRRLITTTNNVVICFDIVGIIASYAPREFCAASKKLYKLTAPFLKKADRQCLIEYSTILSSFGDCIFRTKRVTPALYNRAICTVKELEICIWYQPGTLDHFCDRHVKLANRVIATARVCRRIRYGVGW